MDRFVNRRLTGKLDKFQNISNLENRGADPKILEQLLEFFEKIISEENTYLSYPMIIKILIQKLSILLKNDSFLKNFRGKSLSGLINDVIYSL